MRVTGRSTDTLTVTREQESTSARTVTEGDVVMLGITAKVIEDIGDTVDAADTAATDAEALVAAYNAGWVDADETWTYASDDDPTYTFTISGDKTDKYSAGMRVKLTDSGTQYFIITKVAYSSPNTTVTVYGGTDYDLSGGAITNPYYAGVKAPHGFPLDPAKWTETGGTSNTQASPVNETVYNVGGSIDIPIGVWKVGWRAMGYAYGFSVLYLYLVMGLDDSSTSTGSTGRFLSYDYTRMGSGQTIAYRGSPSHVEGMLTLTTKDTYYLNMSAKYSGSAGTIQMFGAEIWATCAYL
jgi:hypothetical protein